MKRLILLFLLISVPLFGARKTKVITSIINGGKTAENVTINSGYTGTDGTITLSAAVPSTVKVGDTITDSATNTYLITAISGSDLTAQDFDTTTDPATGAATIQEAYQSITTWEADLDVTTLYASGDTAQGECYNDGGDFAESAKVTIDGGGTVGLSHKILKAASGEEHDGTAGTGVVLKFSGSFELIDVNVDSVSIIGIELFQQKGNGRNISIGASNNTSIRRCILHVISTSIADANIQIGTSFATGINILNNIIYGTTTDAVSNRGTISFLNDTIYGATTNGLKDGGTSWTAKNCLVLGSGTADYTGTIAKTTCGSSDATGSSGLQNLVTSNQVISTVVGLEDLHLKNTSADAFEAGTDLGTTPSGVQFDIDNYDRDTGATTWSIGAHDGNNLRGGTANPTLKRRRKVIR